MMRVQKSKVNSGTIENYIMIFVLVIVLFSVIGTSFGKVTEAAEGLNDSGFPLAEFFLADGALWYLVAAGLLFMIYKSFSGSRK